eukprot:COSAG06_NODE_6414_length_2942_cov_15.858600_4_plen_197_part_00
MREGGEGGLFAPFIYIYKRTFSQDRLGTNTGKTPKKGGRSTSIVRSSVSKIGSRNSGCKPSAFVTCRQKQLLYCFECCFAYACPEHVLVKRSSCLYINGGRTEPEKTVLLAYRQRNWSDVQLDLGWQLARMLVGNAFNIQPLRGNETEQDRAEPSRAEPSRTGRRAGQDRAGQDRTGQDRTGQDRAGQDRTTNKEF